MIWRHEGLCRRRVVPKKFKKGVKVTFILFIEEKRTDAGMGGSGLRV